MIAIDNLSFRYPKSERWIFESASLSVPSGKLIGLVGDNGAGKTTLFHLLNNPRFAPFSGKISVDCPIQNRQLVLQQAWLPSLFTAAEAVDWVLNLATPNPVAALTQFHADLSAKEIAKFERLAPIRFGRISTGERQWLLFRLGIFLATDLALLDEPSNGLDPSSRTLLWHTLRTKANQGRTLIVSSHLIHEVAAEVDCVIFIKDRQLERIDDPTALPSRFA